MKFKTYSLGCKVNIYEVEAISSDLIKSGFELTNNDEEADVIIVNTCTVTSTSDSKSRQLIRKIRKLNEKAIIVAMGCYVQLNSSEVENNLNVNIIVGTNKRNQVKELIKEYLENKEVINRVQSSDKYTEYEELKMYGLSTHTRGFIKIQDGCENFCAYCAIPYARGPIKSRKPSDVIDEIKTLASKGVKEIILSGINTGTYGQDLNEDVTLASLLDDILTNVNGCFRLRLSSIELMEITDELLDVYEKYPTKIARHFHIPLQAGCDNTLQRMKRKYLTSDYEKVINKIRNRFPGIAITTDCLAGFVGESDKDFEDALEFIEKINFSSMHIFPYSRRKNTEADKMDGHLPGELIHARAKKMQELAQKMAKNYQEEYIGKEMIVLVEQKKNNYWIGHTSNYLEVKFISKEELTNKLVLVKLNKVDNSTIIAEFIKEVENEF